MSEIDVIEKVSYQTQKKELIEKLLSNYRFEGWSQRPNTFVHVSFVLEDGSNVIEAGWAKVSKTDSWSEDEGIRVAIRKAAARVAKKILLSPEKLEKMYPPLESLKGISGNSTTTKV